MNDHVKLKTYSQSTIQYIVIHTNDKNDLGYIFGSPSTHTILRQLVKFPRDFVQFENPSIYFETAVSISEINPSLNILFLEDNLIDDSLKQYISLLNLQERPTVYFIDSDSKKTDSIINTITQLKHKYFYFCLYNTSSKKSLDCELEKKKFNDNYELINLFKRDFNNFKTALTNEIGFEMKIDDSHNENTFIDFNPTINNQLTFEHINTNIWKNSPPQRKALENHSKRGFVLLDSIKKIDQRHLTISNKLPILIIAFPFYNPTLKAELKKLKHLKQINIELFYALEQDENYNQVLIDEDNSIDQNKQKFGASILRDFIAPKLLTLDAICHLHSSFTFSPTSRFPLKGKSLFKELSFFNPSSSNFKSKKSNKQKAHTILKFGKKLCDSTIPKVTQEYFSKRNGQILTISDLPIEFLTLDGIPLCYSHDICRIQESNSQGFLNNYSAHNKLEYHLSKKTISNILVILSGDAENSPEHEFSTTYNEVISESKNYGFKYSFCNTVNDIKKSLEKYSPEILIFDCHGEIDVSLKTSYLKIGNERMYNSDIIKHKISAPIVYLSCCNTNPNYGYLNKIHDAFFEAGSLTVTGTFLPINITRGTAYYLQMINLLKEALDKNIYNNWLEFISQTIRTSIVHDVILKAKKNNIEYSDFELQKLADIRDDIRDFTKRKRVFKSLMKEGLKISNKLKLNISDTDSEFIMYSHYGRADLIKMKKVANNQMA